MKGLKRIFAVVLIVSIMLSSVVGVNASASESTYIEHTSCVNEHFAWVQNGGNHSTGERYPDNDVGNCAYVAMSLLLSYYDAYWNDSFVPDNLPFEQTGIIDTTNGYITTDFRFALENQLWGSIFDSSGLDGTSAEGRALYGQFIEDYYEDYFNLYLINLAMESNLGVADTFDIYAMTGKMIKNFLELYLYDVLGFSEEQIVVHKESALLPNGRYDMFNQAVEVINNGFPVIYCALEENIVDNNTNEDLLAGHVLLGYKVEGSDIVLSPCWNDNPTTTFSTTDYKYVSSIIWLEINEEAFPHVCSDSYVDANDPTRTFCTCEIYRNHPNHVDSINNGAEVCTAASENATCLCGRSMNGTHNYSTRYRNSYTHWYQCACGAKTNISIHDKTYTQSNSSSHSGYCVECNYTFFEESHSYSKYTKVDASHHKSICDCGYYVIQGHTFDSMLSGYKCRYCGYFTKNIMIPITNIKPEVDICGENMYDDNEGV